MSQRNFYQQTLHIFHHHQPPNVQTPSSATSGRSFPFSIMDYFRSSPRLRSSVSEMNLNSSLDAPFSPTAQRKFWVQSGLVSPKLQKKTSRHFQDQTLAERLLCVICQELEKNIMLEPCRHVSLCAGCSQKLIQHSKDRNVKTLCPMCRTPISSMVIVHI